jgi:hypothetical protein
MLFYHLEVNHLRPKLTKRINNYSVFGCGNVHLANRCGYLSVDLEMFEVGAINL